MADTPLDPSAELDSGAAPEQLPPSGPLPYAGMEQDMAQANPEKGWGQTIMDMGESALTGAAQSVFETKDFIVGEIPREQRSPWRAAIEDRNAQLKREGWQNAFVSGVSQFGVGLLGAGKITAPIKALQGLTGASRVALEVGKGAAVGTVAIDPHEERLSNIIEQFPALSNPMTQYLAAKPGDSAAEGRLKNAIESIGLDIAIVGVIAGGAKVIKGLRAGDDGLVSAGQAEIEAGQTGIGLKEGELPPPGQVLNVDTGVPQVDTVTSDVVPNQTAAMADDGLTPQTVSPDTLRPTAEDPFLLLNTARDDALAVDTFGSVDAAIQNGHKFSRPDTMPWQKLIGGAERGDAGDELLARITEARAAELDTLKGGAVLTDASVQRSINAIARTFNEDPQAITGMIVRAGEDASNMVANMEGAFILASKSSQDLYRMAARIQADELTAWGGDRVLAEQSLKEMVALTATYLGNARSILSNSGRALRRARADFRLTPEQLAAMDSLDPSTLARLIADTGGDPKIMNKALQPGMLSKIRDSAQFLYVNNLLWGWRTHFINFSTNLYMVGGRPLERIIGSYRVGGAEGTRVRAESWKQFSYMGASLSDAWTAAVQTYRQGDSVLHPHQQEAMTMGGELGKTIAQMPWKPMDSTASILHNALAFGAKAIGQPTRLLGTVDELVKQTVYRSKVQSVAHVEGIEQGLRGQDLTTYVQQRLLAAFDDEGRALDSRALQEAMVATFQQDLLPGTLGKSVQTFTTNQPWAKFILPFVRTPTNVLRQGVKMTPGLNLLQTEYRSMIRGEMGAEAQAQAVGQMSMGALFLGTAATLAYSGAITGGGPSDRAERELLVSTGWQPYSFVTTREDGGKTYTPFGRYDPIAMPFGIVADLVDAINAGDEDDTVADRAGTVAMGLLIGVSKQLSNKTYLLSLNQAMDAVMDPDRSMGKTAGQMAANFIPFSAGLRSLNTDPYLRDARDFTDKFLATVPGLSDTVPAKHDVWGNPINVHKGLWVDTPASQVDAEVRRMVEDEGLVLGPVPPTREGVDLRDVIMSTGQNAYETLQKLSGKPTPGAKSLKDAAASLIGTDAYQRAPDGAAVVKGTKQFILTGLISKYREAAYRKLQADPVVREALLKRRRDVVAAYAKNRGEQNGAARPAVLRQIEDLGLTFGTPQQ
jgi:hypothetical protein